MEGLAAGRAEMKQETARKMKKLGIPLQQITDVTGLSEEELGKI
jgi:predicted transposase/invertase (TIGR01784 family)